MPGIEIVFLIVGLAVGFGAGRTMTKEPSEDEMFQRIVSLRAGRKTRAATEESLEAEIERLATERAR